jgi:hypothetical protein
MVPTPMKLSALISENSIAYTSLTTRFVGTVRSVRRHVRAGTCEWRILIDLAAQSIAWRSRAEELNQSWGGRSANDRLKTLCIVNSPRCRGSSSFFLIVKCLC